MIQEHDGEWREGLARCLSPGSVSKHLLGVGNPLGRDDSVGLKIAVMLRRSYGAKPREDVVIHPPAFYQERLLSRLSGAGGTLVIFDAAECGMPPGGILCARLSETNFGYFATHNVPMRLIPGVADSMEKAWVVGIQPEDTTLGEDLSETVRNSAQAVVDQVGTILGERHGRH